LEAVVDGFAAAAALPKDLPVFEPGDDVFDPGSDASMIAVVVVMDDVAGAVAPCGDDRCDAAVAAVTEDVAAIEQLCDGVVPTTIRRCDELTWGARLLIPHP
jgi:hypothetical protein